MSLITTQIQALRKYAAGRKGELAMLVSDAADTIEMLAAKLHAAQMERSSQHYHDGWILCDERLPEEDGQYIVTSKYAHVADYEDVYAECGEWYDGQWDTCPSYCGTIESILAWMPLPDPYREGGKDEE